jgi:hypothetical protein
MRISGIIITLSILVLVSGCLSDDRQTETSFIKPIPNQSEPKENSEAGVTITVLYLDNNTFHIKLDTHSGSLDYKMDKISYIRDNKGNIIKPESWTGGIGGHHFEGTLKFQKFNDNTNFELVIQDVAGVKERILKW